MKTLYIGRNQSTEQGTFGVATLGEFTWTSLELPWRNNAPDISCIPPGTYYAQIKPSLHFNRDVFLLQNVPGRSDVEIHGANWAGDVSKGWHSDLRGCLTLGTHRAVLPYQGKLQDAVVNSWASVQQLVDAAGDELEIVIAGP